MATIYVLLVQACIPLLFGLAATAYLRAVIQRLLVELCGTHDRAEFWVRTTAIVTMAMPLGLVMLFGRIPAAGNVVEASGVAEILKQAIWLSISGILVSVALVARAVRRRIPALAPVQLADGSAS
jgi:uncharacterized membrane protein YhaH (DUF805 family)